MTAQEFSEVLQDLLDDPGDEIEDIYGYNISRISTFESKGMCTTDTGLVIKLDDGSEFYLTIVKGA